MDQHGQLVATFRPSREFDVETFKAKFPEIANKFSVTRLDIAALKKAHKVECEQSMVSLPNATRTLRLAILSSASIASSAWKAVSLTATDALA